MTPAGPSRIDPGCFPDQVVVGLARYFMVMGIDVAVRTEGIGAQSVLSVAEHIVPPGRGLPMHAVPAPTILIVQQGRVTARTPEGHIVLRDSHTAFVPAGTQYAYCNESASEARLVVITFDASHDQFLQEVSMDPRKLRRAAVRNNVQLADDADA